MRKSAYTADLARFLMAGGLNTLLTVAIYELLLFVLSHQASYALAWISGIAFVMIFYPSRVFPGGRTDDRSRLLLGLTYAVVFASGLVTLDALIAVGSPSRISIFATMIVTTVVNFFAARFLLRRD